MHLFVARARCSMPPLHSQYCHTDASSVTVRWLDASCIGRCLLHTRCLMRHRHTGFMQHASSLRRPDASYLIVSEGQASLVPNLDASCIVVTQAPVSLSHGLKVMLSYGIVTRAGCITHHRCTRLMRQASSSYQGRCVQHRRYTAGASCIRVTKA